MRDQLWHIEDNLEEQILHLFGLIYSMRIQVISVINSRVDISEMGKNDFTDSIYYLAAEMDRQQFKALLYEMKQTLYTASPSKDF
mmetsp:Transcript_39415/g.35137  ORF Transcript_39415/g.35137 Transcript_39415/m.35137 type:complete len:85 (+) Transcript_39415:324-578(+)|eukprot:CAMPEP_0114579618 /NCGR_PEP_ID=MMETSP0125-20121206/3956_1 /TAXON_ID=485358 ORGANISM="Aristerostoma sp., Strain ATCC 50986" /NCGR_SAMPLE_ID=MMETSP0125 /ASSEMBLY_ACC=CAM_ASM_000245 /LENGTH=84 /DNA_ID=CAMNT_0001770465 /DNA_START=586 /DNA_END=840 /DNA_ORIENTATION=+